MKPQVGTLPLCISPSRVETAQCPFRYRKLYVEGVHERDINDALLMGVLTHEVAARYFDHLKDSGLQSDLDELAEIRARVWSDLQGPISRWDDYVAFTDTLRDQLLPAPEGLCRTEVRIAMDAEWTPVPFDGSGVEPAYRGVIDLICSDGGGRLLVVDWTNAAIGGTHGTKKDFQTRFYGLMAWLVTKTPITTRVVSLRTGREIETELTESDHYQTREMMTQTRGNVVDLLSATTQEARPSSACTHCRLECPIADEAMAMGAPLRVDTYDRAQWLLERLIVLEQQKKKLLAPLRAFVNEFSAVEAGGHIADIWATSGKRYDPHTVKDQLDTAEIGVDPLAVMKFSPTLLKQNPLFKALPKGERKLLLELIDSTSYTEGGERWGIKAVKGDPDGAA